MNQSLVKITNDMLFKNPVILCHVIFMLYSSIWLAHFKTLLLSNLPSSPSMCCKMWPRKLYIPWVWPIQAWNTILHDEIKCMEIIPSIKKKKKKLIPLTH